MRNRNRTLAALAALTVNALLLSAFTLIGRADAEPSANPPAQTAAANSAPVNQPTATQAAEAPRKPTASKSLTRKVLPVRHFGGY